MLRDAKDATLEFADTNPVSELSALIACTSNLLVPPDEVLEHFDCLGKQAMHMRHVWMELFFTMSGNTLLEEFGKSLEIESEVGLDEIIVECLRKGEMKECLSTCIPLVKDAIMITDENKDKCTQ